MRGGRTVALLAHRPGLLDDSGLVDEIAATARLALENERLQAQVRAQLDDLRASRARIVEQGDAERRLERNLHDGAQQRLVSLALAAARPAGMRERDRHRLEQAEAEVRQALRPARACARAVPGGAHRGGLRALEALAEQASSPWRAGPLPWERFDPKVEATAYFVVAEILNRSRPGHTAVDAAPAEMDGWCSRSSPTSRRPRS